MFGDIPIGIDVKVDDFINALSKHSQYDWGILLLAALAMIVCAAVVVAIVSVWRGNSFKLLGFMIEPDAKIKDLKKALRESLEQFKVISEDSKQKAQWLKLQNTIMREILYIKACESRERDVAIQHALETTVLPNAISILTVGKENVVRGAVLIPEGESLKIFAGNGYSSEGKLNLRLSIDTTVAGTVFQSKKYIYEKDVTKSQTWAKNPKASKEYRSLVCLPILIKDECVGVLNFDGENIDCFNKDDIDAMMLLANNIAVMLAISDNILCRAKNQEVKKGGERKGVKFR